MADDVRPCKGCGKQMRWVFSEKEPPAGQQRKKVPLDHHPARVYRIVDGEARYVRITHSMEPERLEVLEKVAKAADAFMADELVLASSAVTPLTTESRAVDAHESRRLLTVALNEFNLLVMPVAHPVPVYTSHFATCPKADDLRKKREDRDDDE